MATFSQPVDGVPRRRELASFLRARRNAIQPEDVGLPRFGPRRVKGLRRHEVADRAAVSITWYTWLEQARDIHATDQVLDSIARALLLDDTGRMHLRRLAVSEPSVPVEVPNLDPSLAGFVDDQSPAPACLVDTVSDLIYWNPAYAALMGDPGKLTMERRNGLVLMLTDERLRTRLHDWEAESRAAIAAFRAESAKCAGSPRLDALLSLLLAESPLFRDEWQRFEVRRFVPRDQVFVVDGSEIKGRLLLLRPLGSPSAMVMVHQLADDASRERLARLVDHQEDSDERVL